MRKLMVGVLAVAAFAAAPGDARADKHKDEKLGFQLTAPKKWKSMPLSHEDQWNVAKFVCDREYEWNDPTGTSWNRHTPYLDVVLIPFAAAERKGASVEEAPDGKLVIRRAAPWTDLREYLDKTSRNVGGFFFSAETETEINGMKVLEYEITVDKLVDGERRIYGWAFYAEDCIYGLVAEILVNHEKKLKPELLDAVRSFKVFPRTGALPGTGHTGDDIVIKTEDPDEEISDEDAAAKRKSQARRSLLRIQENLGDGWEIVEGKNFTAVSHTDKKYTKEVLEHAEALRDWLDENMGFVGSGYAGQIIIRICADQDEYSAYQSSKGWFSDDIEVATFKDRDGWGDWSMGSLNTGILDIWMEDKNPDLQWAAPNWMANGLRSLIGCAVSKRGKVEFKPSEWDAQSIAELRRGDKLLPGSAFFNMTSEELWSNFDNHRQAEFFLRFLVVGGAQKSKKYRDVFSDYVKSLIFLIDEEEAATPEPTDAAEPATEAEEDEMYRKRQSAWREREKDRLAALIERTFEGWDAKAWEQFDKAYEKDLK